MTGAAVTGVCQLRDMAARRNLIIAQEWRRERSGAGSSPHRKPLACSPEVIYLPGLASTGIHGKTSKIQSGPQAHVALEITVLVSVNSRPPGATPACGAPRKATDATSHSPQGSDGPSPHLRPGTSLYSVGSKGAAEHVPPRMPTFSFFPGSELFL